tara:strand:- start:1749 stop:2015 length:267 start_codon:yes stop_codon:yes gene_type:complete
MAEIIPFPKKKVARLEFEDVVDTALAVTAVNLYGNMYNNPVAGPEDIHTLDITYVKDCIDRASRSNVFSVPAREKFVGISSMIKSKMG